MFALENVSFDVIKNQFGWATNVSLNNLSFYLEIAKRMFRGFCCFFKQILLST